MVRYLACGYRDFRKHPVPPDERLNWEIYVVAEGEMAPVFPHAVNPPLESRYAWVMPPGLSYGWRSGSALPRRYVIHFTTIPDVLQQVVSEQGAFGRKLTSAEIQQVDKIYQRLEKDGMSYSPMSLLRVERAAIDLAILLLNGVRLPSMVPLDRMDEQRVETALTWYREHMSEQPTIEAVASAVHISAGHLRRTFQRARRQSPHAAFLDLRLQRAKELLSSTSQDLQQIGRQCGFRSDSDFCRVFSRCTGVSPHRWRMHITKQEAGASRGNGTHPAGS